MSVAMDSRFDRLRGFLDVDPGNPQLAIDAATAALDEHRYGDVLDLVERYRASAPPPPALLNLAGVAAMSEQRFSDASPIFEELLADTPDDPALKFNLAWCKAMQEAWPEVCDILADEAGLQSGRAAALKVQALHHLGELEDALAYGQTALERFPDDIHLSGILAVVALDAEELSLASRYAAAAGDSAPASAVRGMLMLNEASPTAALASFEQALAQSPTDGRAQLGTGLALMAAGDAAQAAPWLDRGAERFGDHLGSWVAAGWCYFTLGDLAASRARFERALTLDENFAETQGALAVLDITEGQIESGRKRAEVALRLDRQCFGAALAQSLLAASEGETARAEKIRNAALNAPAGPDGQTIAQAISKFGAKRRR